MLRELLRLFCGRFLPTYCPEFRKVILDDSSGKLALREDTRERKEVERRLELPVWLMAWDTYAIGAAVLEQACVTCDQGLARMWVALCALSQMSYKTAIAHKHVVMEIAVNAASEERLPLLGVLYDGIARRMLSLAVIGMHAAHAALSVSRKDWEERAAHQGVAFSVEKVARSVSENLPR